MRVLWIGPNYRYRFNFHHELLADEAARQHDVIRYGHSIDNTPACKYWDEGTHVPRLVEKYKPELVVCQHPRHCQQYTGWRDVNVLKIALAVDYFPRNRKWKSAFLKVNGFDLTLFPERFMVEWAKSESLNAEWLPFAVDTKVFKPLEVSKRYHAMVCFSAHTDEYPNRKAVYESVVSMNSYHPVFALALFNNKDKIYHEDYIRLINQSSLAVTSNDKWGSVNLKHLEYMACGTPMLTDEAEDFQEMGIKPGEYYIKYENPSDVPDLIDHYLEHPELTEPMAQKARELVIEHHDVSVRIKQMFDIVRELV